MRALYHLATSAMTNHLSTRRYFLESIGKRLGLVLTDCVDTGPVSNFDRELENVAKFCADLAPLEETFSARECGGILFSPPVDLPTPPALELLCSGIMRSPMSSNDLISVYLGAGRCVSGRDEKSYYGEMYTAACYALLSERRRAGLSAGARKDGGKTATLCDNVLTVEVVASARVYSTVLKELFGKEGLEAAIKALRKEESCPSCGCPKSEADSGTFPEGDGVDWESTRDFLLHHSLFKALLAKKARYGAASEEILTSLGRGLRMDWDGGAGGYQSRRLRREDIYFSPAKSPATAEGGGRCATLDRVEDVRSKLEVYERARSLLRGSEIFPGEAEEAARRLRELTVAHARENVELFSTWLLCLCARDPAHVRWTVLETALEYLREGRDSKEGGGGEEDDDDDDAEPWSLDLGAYYNMLLHRLTGSHPEVAPSEASKRTSTELLRFCSEAKEKRREEDGTDWVRDALAALGLEGGDEGLEALIVAGEAKEGEREDEAPGGEGEVGPKEFRHPYLYTLGLTGILGVLRKEPTPSDLYRDRVFNPNVGASPARWDAMVGPGCVFVEPSSYRPYVEGMHACLVEGLNDFGHRVWSLNASAVGLSAGAPPPADRSSAASLPRVPRRRIAGEWSDSKWFANNTWPVAALAHLAKECEEVASEGRSNTSLEHVLTPDANPCPCLGAVARLRKAIRKEKEKLDEEKIDPLEWMCCVAFDLALVDFLQEGHRH
jgi:hypothetical protein